ncbi:hypothetical protein BOTBODRAFT_538315 [Botryobasidium botryosum FD-172 SS1]|uniref:Uncharacterized protein n=1 Tax=Botryobasidium botryosum (strain FD-172 SS1) TaxID=930990 RepID=A0A067M2V1_BOTB1|nr:hypothetical protein BOTBODRAFT_538315 [Botryobasidium botryosum FD-172 SS1]
MRRARAADVPLRLCKRVDTRCPLRKLPDWVESTCGCYDGQVEPKSRIANDGPAPICAADVDDEPPRARRHGPRKRIHAQLPPPACLRALRLPAPVPLLVPAKAPPGPHVSHLKPRRRPLPRVLPCPRCRLPAPQLPHRTRARGRHRRHPQLRLRLHVRAPVVWHRSLGESRRVLFA